MSRISVIGNVNIDLLVWPVTELPPPGADLPVETMQIRAAGSAGNTALALAHLGHLPHLVGCVGDDHFGEFILQELAAAGIEEGVAVLPDDPTGISIAFEAPGRDRSFLTLLGSLEGFRASMVPPEALTKDFVLFCGYFSLPSLRGEPTLRLLERVRAAGGCTLFDCDWDPAGCAAFGPGEEHRIPAPLVRVSDTTGAGDSFNSGLLYALSDGAEWSDALRFATRR